MWSCPLWLRHQPASEEVVSCGTSVTGSLCLPLTQKCVWYGMDSLKVRCTFVDDASCAVCTRECSCPCGATTSRARHCCKSQSTVSKPRVSLLDNHLAKNKSPAKPRSHMPLSSSTTGDVTSRTLFALPLSSWSVPSHWCLQPAKIRMSSREDILPPTKAALRNPVPCSTTGTASVSSLSQVSSWSVPSVHDAWHLGPVGNEARTRIIVISTQSLAHAAAVDNDAMSIVASKPTHANASAQRILLAELFFKPIPSMMPGLLNLPRLGV